MLFIVYVHCTFKYICVCILGKVDKTSKGYDVIIEVCGVKQALIDNLNFLKPGGLLMLVGLCHPNSAMDITAEKIIRNCWTIIGK